MGVFGQEERGKLMENNHQLPEPLPGYTTVTLWVILYSAAFYPEFTEQQHTCSEIHNLAKLHFTFKTNFLFKQIILNGNIQVDVRCYSQMCYYICVLLIVCLICSHMSHQWGVLLTDLQI